MKTEIQSAYDQIPDIVSKSMLDTLATMFGTKVSYHESSAIPFEDKQVLASVRMNHGGERIDFWFKFDIQLLLQAASFIFTPEYLKMSPVHDDLACEIANIVCHKAKDYMVEEGYYSDMGFPFVVKPEDAKALTRGVQPEMYFHYVKNENQVGLGVTINMTVA